LAASGYDNPNILKEESAMPTIPKDPVILLSFLNTRLRDYYSSLDALCEDLEQDPQELTKKIAAIGYTYDSEKNQFI
jgi:hypothetical protein